MVSTDRTDNIVGAKLDKITLYSASISLEFDKNGTSITISTGCNFLLEGEIAGDGYPLSSLAFLRLTQSIGGHARGIAQKSSGDWQLTIEDEVFILQYEESIDGIFRLSGSSGGHPEWDEFF